MIEGEALANMFQRHGAVVVRGLLSDTELGWLRDGIESNLASPSPRAMVASTPDDPGQFFEDFRNWDRIADYRRLVETTGLGALAGLLMGSKTVRFYHDHLLVKAAGTRQTTPWHQDQPYYNIDGSQTCSLWIPADPVPKESSLRFVAGSHRGPWLMPRTFLSNEARWFPDGALSELPDIDGDPTSYEILSWALQPGDVVAFSMLTLHAAAGSAGSRRVLSLRYIGDDVTYAPRPWKTSPDFPELAGELAPGAAMDHPLFPIIWRGS